jgi:UDP-N-acetylmuramoyl-tripeptide--D-alanyl-D-alanine ligase
MNLQDFSNILKEEIIHIINSNDHEEYIINSFFWVAQQYSSNDIFFAIKGLNTDGNIFIPTAIENGYKYVLSDNEEAIKVNSIQYSNIIFFFVKNVQNTLNILAEWGVGKFKGIKICITGSAGKTTTSYLLKNLLNDFSSVISTSKYNSQYYLRRIVF